MQLVSKLQSEAKQVWLTCREHVHQYVQSHLQVFPIKLLPITESDQFEYCERYYDYRLKKLNVEFSKHQIEDFCKILIESISHLHESISTDLLGIPLLMKMLAAVNFEHCKTYVRDSTETCNLVKNIFDLFDQFVEKSISRTKLEKRRKDAESATKEIQLPDNEILDKHMTLAFLALLDENLNQTTESKKCFLRKLSKYKKDDYFKKIGIITDIDIDKNVIKFLHFTFAEFLLAKFIIEKLNDDAYDVQALLDEVLRKGRWKIVRHFLEYADLPKASYGHKYDPTAADENEHKYKVKDEVKDEDDDEEEDEDDDEEEDEDDDEEEDEDDDEEEDDDDDEEEDEDDDEEDDDEGEDEDEYCDDETKSIELAILECNKNIFKFLINCLPAEKSPKVSKWISLHETDIMTPLVFAARFNFLNEIKTLLLHEAQVNPECAGQYLALHAAIEAGHYDACELLLQNGANVNCRNMDGRTAIHLAARSSNVKFVKLLHQQYGARLNETGKTKEENPRFHVNHNSSKLEVKNNARPTVLMFSTRNQDHDVITYVLSAGCNVDEKDRNGFTALYYAAECGHILHVKSLLDAGADIESRDNEGWTAIFVAAHNSSLDTVKFLHHRGAKVDVKNKAGCTLLMCLAQIKQHEFLTYVVTQVRNVNDKDDKGRTALHFAAKCGQSLNVKSLLDAGADIDSTDNKGRTAILLAAELSKDDTVKLLLQRGARPEVKDNAGYIMLMYLAGNEDHDVFTLVLSAGCKVDDKDEDGWTALHHAAKWGRCLNVQSLLDTGADIESRDNKGQTALHVAATWSWGLQCAQYLLQRGADRTAVDKEGKTVLDLCVADTKPWLQQNMDNMNIVVEGKLTNNRFK